MAFDKNLDYSKAIEDAKNNGGVDPSSGKSTSQLQSERLEKIDSVYGGKEPTMWGSNTTYSQASGSGDKNTINSAIDYAVNNNPSTRTGQMSNYTDSVGTDWEAMYRQALAMLQNAQKSAPTYANSYEGQLKDIYDQIVNRDKFQYDINQDMLYQQYAQQYQKNGRLAMQDTMGQAAALTGGYDSSYGQAVGQQQYDAYLQQLNDVVPELYNQAYQMYQDEGDQLLQQYSMLGDLADREYKIYSDAYDRWFSETNAALDQYNRDRDFDYQKEQDALALEYNKTNADREYQLALDKFNYQKDQDKVAQQNASKKDTTETKKYDTRGYTTEQIKQLQRAAGINEDGIWGPATEQAYLAGYRPTGNSGTYTLSELLDAAAGGMTKAQIEAVLTNRGVNVNNSAVQADIKWALSK